MTAVPRPRISPDRYLEMEARAAYKSEYYEGEVFAMSGGSPDHSRIQVNVLGALHAQLRGRSCQVFSSDLRVLIEPVGLYTYPDASIVCGEQRFDDHDNLLNPTLLVEVLSPSTEAYDRGRKFDMYRQLESLLQYLLISQDEHKVHLFTRQRDGSWLFRAFTALEDRVPLEAIGCELTVSDLYENVTLPPASSLRPPAAS